MEQDDAPAAMGSAQARQRLLAIFGQVQAYIFQVEMLKRCDPSALLPLVGSLKLNALTIRMLRRKLGELSSNRRSISKHHSHAP